MFGYPTYVGELHGYQCDTDDGGVMHYSIIGHQEVTSALYGVIHLEDEEYVYTAYPRWKYKAATPSVVVVDADVETALGAGWENTPQ